MSDPGATSDTTGCRPRRHSGPVTGECAARPAGGGRAERPPHIEGSGVAWRPDDLADPVGEDVQLERFRPK